MARAMADRWPAAEVTGSDLSPEMLTEAATVPSRVSWEIGDVRNWQPDRGHDVIYSNAVLHWVDDHAELLPRLVSYLNPGGVLAIQMPLSWHEPSHQLMRATLATGGPGGSPLGDPALRQRYERPPVESPGWYHTILEPTSPSSTSGRPGTSRSSTARSPCTNGSQERHCDRFSRAFREANWAGSSRSTDRHSRRRTRHGLTRPRSTHSLACSSWPHADPTTDMESPRCAAG